MAQPKVQRRVLRILWVCRCCSRRRRTLASPWPLKVTQRPAKGNEAVAPWGPGAAPAMGMLHVGCFLTSYVSFCSWGRRHDGQPAVPGEACCVTLKVSGLRAAMRKRRRGHPSGMHWSLLSTAQLPAALTSPRTPDHLRVLLLMPDRASMRRFAAWLWGKPPFWR